MADRIAQPCLAQVSHHLACYGLSTVELASTLGQTVLLNDAGEIKAGVIGVVVRAMPLAVSPTPDDAFVLWPAAASSGCD